MKPDFVAGLGSTNLGVISPNLDGAKKMVEIQNDIILA